MNTRHNSGAKIYPVMSGAFFLAGAGTAASIGELAGEHSWAVMGVTLALIVWALYALASVQKVQRTWHQELSRFVGDIEGGNLTARIDPIRVRGESALVERMNAMTRSLVQVFVSFTRLSHEMASVADETTRNAS